MFVDNNEERGQLLNFLLQRWIMLTDLSTIESVYLKYRTNNTSGDPMTSIINTQPTRQIEIIKQQIIKILPKAKFIDYTYVPPAPLNVYDFAEIYAAENRQCIDKIRDLMENSSN